MTSIPVKLRTGRHFQVEDDLGIAEPVWDNVDPTVHRLGVGSGGVNPRWYPGVDKQNNFCMSYGTLIKGALSAYGDNGFGFEGDNFIVRMQGKTVLKLSGLGLQVLGAITQPNANPEYLPSDSGLGELLFPLFTNKALIAQFDRPAMAGIGANGGFYAYRSLLSAFNGFGCTYTRGGGADLAGVVTYIDKSGRYARAATNEPRVTYDPISRKCRGLLLEPAATNLIAFSYDLSYWTLKSLTLTPELNDVWRDRGLHDPFTFSENNEASEHSFRQDHLGDPSLPLALSFFFDAKVFSGIRRFSIDTGLPDRSQFFGVYLEVTSNGVPYYTGDYVGGNGKLLGFTVDAIGFGIYRLKIVGVVNGQASGGGVTLNGGFVSLGDSPGNINPVFAPNPGIGKWCSICDFQFEQNKIATSYMQTSATPLSRNADHLIIPLGFTFWTQEGLFEFKFRARSVDVDGVLFSLQNDTGVDRIDYYVSAATADTLTIGSKIYKGNNLTTTNNNLQTTPRSRSIFVFSYTALAIEATRLVLDGGLGFFGTVNLISYE